MPLDFHLNSAAGVVCGEECRKEFMLMETCRNYLAAHTHPLGTTGLGPKAVPTMRGTDPVP